MESSVETTAERVDAIAKEVTYASEVERCATIAWVHREADRSFDFGAAAGGICAAREPNAWIAAAAGQ